MIDFLLDTDTCIYLIRRQPAQALARLKALNIWQVGISTITLSELEYGVSKSSKPEQNKLALAEFAAPPGDHRLRRRGSSTLRTHQSLAGAPRYPDWPVGHPDRSTCIRPRLLPRDEQRQGVFSHSRSRCRELDQLILADGIVLIGHILQRCRLIGQDGMARCLRALVRRCSYDRRNQIHMCSIPGSHFQKMPPYQPGLRYPGARRAVPVFCFHSSDWSP